MYFGDLLETIFLSIDKTGTESGVAMACFMFSPFSVLLLFFNLTDRVQQERSPSPPQNPFSCLESTTGTTFAGFDSFV